MSIPKNNSVSVITAAYNSGNYILKCVNSTLREKCVLEHIVVDDGSTDETRTILSKVKDKRLKIITQKNAGPARARNRAIVESKGKYLINVDADDQVWPLGIDRKWEFLEANKEHDWVIGNMVHCFENGELTYIADSNLHLQSMGYREFLFYMCQIHHLPDNQPMWRKKVLENVGGYQDIFGEDSDLAIRLLLEKHMVGFLDQVTGVYLENSIGLAMGGSYEKRFPSNPDGTRHDMFESNRERLLDVLFTDDARPRIPEGAYLQIYGEAKLILELPRQSPKRFTISRSLAEFMQSCNGKSTIASLVKEYEAVGVEKIEVLEALYALFRRKLLEFSWNDDSTKID